MHPGVNECCIVVPLHSGQFRFHGAGTSGQNHHREYRKYHPDSTYPSRNTRYASQDDHCPMEIPRCGSPSFAPFQSTKSSGSSFISSTREYGHRLPTLPESCQTVCRNLQTYAHYGSKRHRYPAHRQSLSQSARSIILIMPSIRAQSPLAPASGSAGYPDA